MFYLLLFPIAVISPMIAAAEPIAILAGLSSKVSWFPVALILAAGQTVFFSTIYLFGSKIVTRWAWLEKKLSSVDVEKYSTQRNSVTVLSGLFGLPPTSALALAGRHYDPSFLRFASLVATTRLIRFMVCAGAPSLFSEYIDLSILPEWMAPYF